VGLPLALVGRDPFDYTTGGGHLLIELGNRASAMLIRSPRIGSFVESGNTMVARELQLQLSLTHSSDTGGAGN